MRGRKWVYIHAGVRVGRKGTSGKFLWACIGHGLSWRHVLAGHGEDAVGDDWWKKAWMDG